MVTERQTYINITIVKILIRYWRKLRDLPCVLLFFVTVERFLGPVTGYLNLLKVICL